MNSRSRRSMISAIVTAVVLVLTPIHAMSASAASPHSRSFTSSDCAGSSYSQATLKGRADALMYSMSLSSFSALSNKIVTSSGSMRSSPRYADCKDSKFNWRNDGCSSPVHLPSSVRPACVRHDFGYRNYGKGRKLHPSEAERHKIDLRLKSEVNSIAGSRWASAIYVAVEEPEYGAMAFYDYQCDSGFFCAYSDIFQDADDGKCDQQPGECWRVQFDRSVPRLGKYANGAINDSIRSVRNNVSGNGWRVFKDASYHSTSQCIGVTDDATFDSSLDEQISSLRSWCS